jgi:outer membrane protein TolC
LKIGIFLLGVLNLPHLDVEAKSLQDALAIAFENNPRTEATRLRLESFQLNAKAARYDIFPQFYFQYNISENQSAQNVLGVLNKNHSRSRGQSFSINMNLYNGGADVLSAKAAEERTRAQEAIFNSTNSLIPNTKGSIANLVMNAYIHVSLNMEALDYITNRLMWMNLLYNNSKTSDERNQYLNQIEALQIAYQNTKASVNEARKSYEFVVTVPAPDVLDTTDEIIDSLLIPENASQAYEIALVKGPDIVASRHTLEAIRLSGEATKRRSFYPRVDAHISRGYNHNSSILPIDSNSRSNSTHAGVSLGWRFDIANIPRTQSNDKQEEAAMADFVATQAELEFDIKKFYSDLLHQENVLAKAKESFERIDRELMELLEQAKSGKIVDVNYALNIFTSYERLWNQIIGIKMSILTSRFKIQRTIGTLFDEYYQSSEFKKQNPTKH